MSDRCGNNHDLTGENLYISPKGKRDCRECARERIRSHRDRTHDAVGPADWQADDVDRVAVERYLNGVPVGRKLHHAEVLEIVRHYLRRPEGPEGLANLLRTSDRKVRKLIEEATP